MDNSGKPDLTGQEIGDVLVFEWVDVGEAVERMKTVEPTSELGRFIQERDR